MSEQPTLVLIDGVLDRLKVARGITTDRAMAGLIGVSETTYNQVKTGQRPATMQFIAGLSAGLGVGIGEITTIVLKSGVAA